MQEKSTTPKYVLLSVFQTRLVTKDINYQTLYEKSNFTKYEKVGVYDYTRK